MYWYLSYFTSHDIGQDSDHTGWSINEYFFWICQNFVKRTILIESNFFKYVFHTLKPSCMTAVRLASTRTVNCFIISICLLFSLTPHTHCYNLPDRCKNTTYLAIVGCREHFRQPWSNVMVTTIVAWSNERIVNLLSTRVRGWTQARPMRPTHARQLSMEWRQLAQSICVAETLNSRTSYAEGWQINKLCMFCCYNKKFISDFIVNT